MVGAPIPCFIPAIARLSWVLNQLPESHSRSLAGVNHSLPGTSSAGSGTQEQKQRSNRDILIQNALSRS